jgi:predicted lipoprotein with Yx(FWY)xxD motif
MRITGRTAFAVGSMIAAALLAGCGATGGGGLYGASSSPTSAPATATSGSTGASVVQTASVAVKGQQETVLTDTRGYTLYYFDNDTVSASSCSGSCAQAWPPLTASGSSIQKPAGVNGTLSVVNDANGAQVAYNGHPLYTYSGDSAPGQSNGDGIEGKWHVATPSTTPNKNSGGGYGY